MNMYVSCESIVHFAFIYRFCADRDCVDSVFFFNGFIVCVSLLHLSEIGDGRDRHLQREVI